MSGPLLYDFGGLVTAPGLMARNPASCIDVQNFRFPQRGVMRKRPGFARQTGTAGVNEVFTSLMSSAQLGDQMLAMGGGVGVRTIYKGGAASWSALTDPDASSTGTDAPRARVGVLGGNHYVNGPGLRRLTGSSGPHYAAGMPRGLEPWTYSMNPAVYAVLGGAAGFLADGASAAYRVTWHVKSGGTELSGPPTGRLTIRNITGTSGYVAATARNVTLRIPVPYGLDSTTQLLTTSHYWRLWRSRVAPTAADVPDDDMYLVAENFLSSTDITNGYAVVTDATPDVFMLAQPPLNTNSLNYQEAGLDNGQTFADDPPPSTVQDFAVFADCMWFTMSYERAFLLLNLISASFAPGNTIVINGTTLTAVAGVPVNPGDFTIITTLASLSLNIEATARNIVDAFNRTSGRAAVAAFHTAVGTNAPGYIALESTTSTGGFTVQSATAGALFRPNITTARNTNPAGAGNTLAFSKPSRPDAVPVANRLTVGPSDATILRVVPFRERLLVFTTVGLYQIDGRYFGDFVVSLTDASLQLLQMDAVAVLEDRCYAWCRSGIAEITDGGTSIVSAEIDPTIRDIFQKTHDPVENFDLSAFVVTDTASHLVYFFYANTLDAAARNNTKWLEYDVRERKWSAGAFTNGIGVACGVEIVASGVTALANGSANVSAPTGVARFFQSRSAYAGTTVYQDDNAAGTPSAVAAFAKFQLQSPDPDSRWHWQQLLVHFEDNEFTFFPRPTAFKLRWASDIASLADVSFVPTAAIFRCETPTAARRATRQQVVLTHDTNEPCGLIALNQSYSGAPARFPK